MTDTVIDRQKVADILRDRLSESEETDMFDFNDFGNDKFSSAMESIRIAGYPDIEDEEQCADEVIRINRLQDDREAEEKEMMEETAT